MSIPDYLKLRLGNVFTALEKYNFPRNGSVDSDILLTETLDSRWRLVPEQGYYYYNGRLQYNYISQGKEDFTLVNGVNNITVAEIFTNKGGVLVFSGLVADGASGEIPYVRHYNCLQPATEGVWTQYLATTKYKATVGAGYDLLKVRTLTGELTEVYALVDLTTTSEYYYDTATKIVYIIPDDALDIQIYLDLVSHEPVLKYRELVINEEGNKVKPTYKVIDQVSIIRGDLLETQYGSSPFTDEYIEHSLDIDVGAWVVLEYYIQQSYIVTSTTELSVYTYVSGSDKISVYYEKGLPEHIDTLASKTIEINPYFSESYVSGYVIHSDTTPTGVWEVASVKIASNKTKVCNEWEEEVIVTGILLDKENNPVPGYACTVGITNGAIVGASPIISDNKGLVCFKAIPSSGSALASVITLTSNAIAAAVTITKYVQNDIGGNAAYLNLTDIQQKGQTMLAVIDRDLYPIIINLDGIPCNEGGGARTNYVQLMSEKPAKFSFSVYSAENAISTTLIPSSSNVFNLQKISIETETSNRINFRVAAAASDGSGHDGYSSDVVEYD